MAKKSKAQLKRLMQRAEARGDTYVPPPDDAGNDQSVPKNETTSSESKNKFQHGADDNGPAEQASTKKGSAGSTSKEDKVKRNAAIQLKKELATIESSEDMKAKERRSAKRRAEAIAVETSGFASVEELLAWYQANDGGESEKDERKREKNDNQDQEKKANPYIVFVGQLSFETTKEQLFQHIKKQLEDDNHKVSNQNLKIRLLTDPKTKKSRGMAFVEVQDDPELLYSCLKLHHTHLDGRRINVERSAGGGKHSETRKQKLKQFRDDQTKYMDETVNTMLEEYYKRGEIQKEGELDDGVISLCKRHSAAVVQASLERYVESNGRDMDNPSAYLTFLVGKLAEEGIYHDNEKEKNAKQQQPPRSSNKRERGGKSPPKRDSSNKRPKNQQSNKFADSEFAKQGIDMEAAASQSGSDIFPSLARRGRGRGYM